MTKNEFKTRLESIKESTDNMLEALKDKRLTITQEDMKSYTEDVYSEIYHLMDI